MHQELNGNGVVNFHEARNRHHLSKKKLEVDVEQYQEYLDKSELSDQEKHAFLHALWNVILAFVDLGYGVHPTQSATGEVINLAAEYAARNSSKNASRRATHVR